MNKSMVKIIKKVLIERGMTQSALADAIGKPFNTLKNIFVKDNMRAETLIEIADALGCDVVLRDRESGKIFD